MIPDSPLVRVRKARCRISEECGHDPKRLVEYYMKLQERHRDRLVRSTDIQSKRKPPDSGAEDAGQ
ncbi:MAG TPA: hypothetical protein VMY42_17140 [Thermoguttaceae bacterium]|nr:hypothetical protein [Thermoguttaceae bacterium]